VVRSRPTDLIGSARYPSNWWLLRLSGVKFRDTPNLVAIKRTFAAPGTVDVTWTGEGESIIVCAEDLMREFLPK
jgi:hypothetical protein